MWETKRRWGLQRELGEGFPGEQRATRPSVEEEPVFPLLGASAPGGHQLCKPEPAAD